jgi:sensor histidine kinase YesM
MTSPALPMPDKPFGQMLVDGFRASPLSIALIAALCTGIALCLWVGDPRPFWHPLVTCQLYGFSIAYFVNAASPWEKPQPIRRLTLSVLLGSLVGVALVIVVKRYDFAYFMEHLSIFAMNIVAAVIIGLFVSLFFFVKMRESLAEAALQRAEAERHLLSRQAMEAQLKMMQAQVEPHFLFNTLASVQYLTETDPPRAGVMLGHLIAYLRAALPQLRASSSTLGQEGALIEAYLNILKMRMGERLAFRVDIPDDLRTQAFPPNLVMSLVENAVRHGVEPAVQGGRIDVDAKRAGDSVVVRVADTGSGVGGVASPTAGGGIGLANVRERLTALYGGRAQFALVEGERGGAVATITIPRADAAAEARIAVAAA